MILLVSELPILRAASLSHTFPLQQLFYRSILLQAASFLRASSLSYSFSQVSCWVELKLPIYMCQSVLVTQKLLWLFYMVSSLKYFLPDSGANHLHRVFTGTRLASSMVPTNVKHEGRKYVPVAATGWLSRYCIWSKQCSWVFKYSKLTNGQLRTLGGFI